MFEAERGRLRTHAQRVDELARARGDAALRRRRRAARASAAPRRASALEAFRWDRQIGAAPRAASTRHDAPARAALARARLEARRGRPRAALAGKLDSLSPLAVLSRGYALVLDARTGRLRARAPTEVAPGDALRIRLHEGALRRRASPAKESE